MQNRTVDMVSQAIFYIEDHLDEPLDLDTMAEKTCCSKYHLHRLFAKSAGMTLHSYVRRRRLTEAARMLVFSEKPVLEIALESGYESQQAFSDVFREMYKITPARFRAAGAFYPLQLEISLEWKQKNKMRQTVQKEKGILTGDGIRYAVREDVSDWMELVYRSIDGYPRLDEKEYLENLYLHIENRSAVILRDAGETAGIMGFSGDGRIDFLAVHPRYRSAGAGIEGIFVNWLADGVFRGKEISVTTFCAGDKADTGWRRTYLDLGFQRRELLTEYGYPVQRLVLPPKQKEEGKNDVEYRDDEYRDDEYRDDEYREGEHRDNK